MLEKPLQILFNIYIPLLNYCLRGVVVKDFALPRYNTHRIVGSIPRQNNYLDDPLIIALSINGLCALVISLSMVRAMSFTKNKENMFYYCRCNLILNPF